MISCEGWVCPGATCWICASHSPGEGMNHFWEVLPFCAGFTQCLDNCLRFTHPLSDVSGEIRWISLQLSGELIRSEPSPLGFIICSRTLGRHHIITSWLWQVMWCTEERECLLAVSRSFHLFFSIVWDRIWSGHFSYYHSIKKTEKTKFDFLGHCCNAIYIENIQTNKKLPSIT